MNWNPEPDFFNRKAQNNVTWQQKQFSSWEFPLHFFECKIQGFGYTANGYAVDSDAHKAMTKAFAEAWERLWFYKTNATNKEISSTSGFAAGASNEMAIQNAREELIERAILLKAWSSQSGWRKSKIKLFKSKYIQFALILKGWQLELFEIHSNLGEVKCLFAKHRDRGLIFDSCYSNEGKTSEIKILNSILKNIFLPRLTPLKTLNEKALPVDHARYYCDPTNLKAFEFLKKQTHNKFVFELESPDLIETTILHQAGDLPAVAYCQHPTWPKISWGTSSIQGKNPWPHPLA